MKGFLRNAYSLYLHQRKADNRNVLAFAAECGETKDDKPRNVPQLLLESVPSP